MYMENQALSSSETGVTAPTSVDTDYLYRRAEQELVQAQRAEHPAVVQAHYVLASYYLDQVYGPDDADSKAAA
ncbi:hypothetical protein [Sphingomonas sp. Y38-1Y]|uniref:hypothetical protein n=1 Tax=Sphingomonas sp. Y38-1Y TaxID=3078265 RepID=UPI0028E1B53A|nr:hypothetical protein [Sphingomonas sp. Y38-1Y]